jgi:FkbM family methyltransferase
VTSPSLGARLDALLSEPIASIVERERTAFDNAAGALTDHVVLWGAGRLGRQTLAGLRSLGIEPRAFCDSSQALWGTEVQGVPVMSPRDAATRYGVDATFVVTIWGPHDGDTMAARKQQLVDLGCTKVVSFAPLFWKSPDVFGSYYAFQAPHRTAGEAKEIRRAFSLWSDEASRAEFVAQIEWRIGGNFDVLSTPVGHQTYFPDDLVNLRTDELFVDCGAYDGDTIRALLTRDEAAECRVVAFEPDPATFVRLQEYVSTLPREYRQRLELHQTAVGATRSRIPFDPTGTEASVAGVGPALVDCVSLDDVLDVRDPTYIKMDIEGFEPEALAGAHNVIQRSRPVLAICVYHEFDHPWRIPLSIAALADRYRFFLRPHRLQGWDLVCYAVPSERLKRT